MTKKSNSNGFSNDLIRVGVLISVAVFLIDAAIFIMTYFDEQPRFYGEVGHQTYILLYLVGALFSILALVGLLQKRVFGYYVGLLMILLNFILGLNSLNYNVALALFGFGLLSICFISLIAYRHQLKKRDKTDNMILLITIMILPLYFLVNEWGQKQPMPGDYVGIVAGQATEKNDVTLCNKLEIGRDECIRIYGENKKDSEICKIISADYSRDRCYLHIAESTKNANLCKLIKDQYDRGLCDDVSRN